MKPVLHFELPDEQRTAYQRARRLEWISLGYIASSAVAMYMVMGASQAMRTSWLEDVVSLVPPIAFLVAGRVATSRPSAVFPYGKHAAVSIGYLTAALALLAMGAFLLIEAVRALVSGHPTTIGGFDVFGTTVWGGWPMLAALTYGAVPALFLGRAKQRLAPVFHDKILHADAEMNRADWMAESAAAVGVLGVGFGWPLLDPIAAAVVSLDIIRDGLVSLRASVTDLMDESPKTTTDEKRHDSLPARLRRHLESFDWVERAEVRMREEGHVFFGEAFVVPKTSADLVAKVAALAQEARAFNWRIHDMTVMPVTREMVESPHDESPGSARREPSSAAAAGRRAARRGRR